VAAIGEAATHRTTNLRILLLLVALAVTLLAAAASPTLAFACVAMVPLGAAMLAAPVTNNASVQLVARPDMRGRAIAFYFLLSQGSNVVGAPLIGWVAQSAGARWALVLAAGGAVVGAVAWFSHARLDLGASVQERAPDEIAAVVAGG
jgi:predicted MFS family arabinose efflux permease